MVRFAAFFGILLCAAAARSHPAMPAPIDYSSPGTLVDVGGRHVHLVCAGSGSPTVVLTAGLGNSAVVWDQVQRQIAGVTRVCAWDRAGFGFSVGSPRPQTALERTIDLERALHGAHITGPFVIVGHSLGSYESLVFADRNKRDVAGMVLVDPSLPDEMRRLGAKAPAAMAYSEKRYAQSVDIVAHCAAQIRSRKVSPGNDPEGCFQYPPYYPAALTARLVRLDTDPLRQQTKLSLYRHSTDSLDARTAPVVNPRRNYGDMPVIVLSSDPPFKPPADAPAAAVAQQKLVEAEWRRGHDELAHLSVRGEHRIIAGSQHAIQRSNPDAVSDAVIEVVIEARRKN